MVPLPVCRLAVKQAASGDAKASVVSRMIPMPVGIEQTKQEEKNEKTFGRFTVAGADRGL
jgi:hypothetical protein